LVSANLDLVRSIYADWERGDFSHGEWADPAIEFAVVDGPEAGSCWKGLAGLVEAWRTFIGAWEDGTVHAYEYRELNERVLVLGEFAGRGKLSGLELEVMQTDMVALFHTRDGKVIRLVFYFDRDRALADLGLER
jgi:ketosteroid isomerase-like protein